MKTKAILSVIITLVLSINMYAANPVVLKSEEKTEFGRQLEQISLVKGTNIMDKRTLSNYNHAGMLIEKTSYKWIAFDGWIPTTKLVYGYNSSNKLETVSCTKWNEKAKKWDTKSSIAHYNTTTENSVYNATTNNSVFTVEVLNP